MELVFQTVHMLPPVHKLTTKRKTGPPTWCWRWWSTNPSSSKSAKPEHPLLMRPWRDWTSSKGKSSSVRGGEKISSVLVGHHQYGDIFWGRPHRSGARSTKWTTKLSPKMFQANHQKPIREIVFNIQNSHYDIYLVLRHLKEFWALWHYPNSIPTSKVALSWGPFFMFNSKELRYNKMSQEESSTKHPALKKFSLLGLRRWKIFYQRMRLNRTQIAQ